MYKNNFQRRLIGREIDLIEGRVLKRPYNFDLRLVMTWLHDICHRMRSDMIFKCWPKTGLVSTTTINDSEKN